MVRGSEWPRPAGLSGRRSINGKRVTERGASEACERQAGYDPRSRSGSDIFQAQEVAMSHQADATAPFVRLWTDGGSNDGYC